LHPGGSHCALEAQSASRTLEFSGRPPSPINGPPDQSPISNPQSQSPRWYWHLRYRLASSWLGFSTLTRATQVRVPVAEIYPPSLVHPIIDTTMPGWTSTSMFEGTFLDLHQSLSTQYPTFPCPHPSTLPGHLCNTLPTPPPPHTLRCVHARTGTSKLHPIPISPAISNQSLVH